MFLSLSEAGGPAVKGLGRVLKTNESKRQMRGERMSDSKDIVSRKMRNQDERQMRRKQAEGWSRLTNIPTPPSSVSTPKHCFNGHI